MTEIDTTLAPTPANVKGKLPFRLSLGAFLAVVVAPLTSNFAVAGHVLVADIAVLLAIGLLTFRANILLLTFNIRTFRRSPQLQWICALAILATISAAFAFFSSYGSQDVFARLRIVAFLTLSFAILYRAFSPPFADRILRLYLGLSLVASVVVIIQVIWFKATGLILAPDLSAIAVEQNSVFHVDISGEFRTGGLFREPSWLIVFIVPASYWFYRFGSKARSTIVTIGILLSTSTLGLLVLVAQILDIYVLRAKKKLRNTVVLVVLVLVTAAAVIPLVPAIEHRALENLAGTGTISVRLFAPVLVVSDQANWSLLGVNTNWMRSTYGTEEDWLNSAVYAIILLGFPWAILFYVALFKIGGRTGGVTLFILIIFEGCIGRAAFWAAFAVLGIMKLVESKSNLDRVPVPLKENQRANSSTLSDPATGSDSSP